MGKMTKFCSKILGLSSTSVRMYPAGLSENVNKKLKTKIDMPKCRGIISILLKIKIEKSSL